MSGLRRLLRLLIRLLPALLLAAAWAGWWLFGDGPIKVSRPDRPIVGAGLRAFGPTTVVETPYEGMDSQTQGFLYWRSLDTGKCIIEPVPCRISKVILTRDEQTLIAIPEKAPIRLYDRATGRLRAELPELGPWKVRPQLNFLTLDTRLLAYELAAGGVIVADVQAGRIVHQFREWGAPVGISQDGQFLVAAADRHTLVLHDLANDREIARTACNDVTDIVEPVVGPSGRRILLMTRHAGQTVHEVWSPDPPGRQQIDVRPTPYLSLMHPYGR